MTKPTRVLKCLMSTLFFSILMYLCVRGGTLNMYFCPVYLLKKGNKRSLNHRHINIPIDNFKFHSKNDTRLSNLLFANNKLNIKNYNLNTFMGQVFQIHSFLC